MEIKLLFYHAGGGLNIISCQTRAKSHTSQQTTELKSSSRNRTAPGWRYNLQQRDNSFLGFTRAALPNNLDISTDVNKHVHIIKSFKETNKWGVSRQWLLFSWSNIYPLSSICCHNLEKKKVQRLSSTQLGRRWRVLWQTITNIGIHFLCLLAILSFTPSFMMEARKGSSFQMRPRLGLAFSFPVRHSFNAAMGIYTYIHPARARVHQGSRYSYID